MSSCAQMKHKKSSRKPYQTCLVPHRPQTLKPISSRALGYIDSGSSPMLPGPQRSSSFSDCCPQSTKTLSCWWATSTHILLHHTLQEATHALTRIWGLSWAWSIHGLAGGPASLQESFLLLIWFLLVGCFLSILYIFNTLSILQCTVH